MITVQLIGDSEVIARLSAIGSRLPSGVARAVTRLALELTRRAQQKLSGEVLNVRSGVLRSSIHPSPTTVTATGASATVGTNVKYARIHEYGGTIHHPGGTPYEVISGVGTVFVSLKSARAAILPKTRPHDIHMPERSFLRSSLREIEPRIKAEIEAAVSEELHRG